MSNNGKTATQLLKYVVAGILSAFATIGVGFVVNIELANEDIAAIAGWCAGIICSFLMQKFWVFTSQGQVATKTIKFLLVTTIAWLIGVLFYFIATRLTNLNFTLIQIAVLIIVSGINFTANKYWTFK